MLPDDEIARAYVMEAKLFSKESEILFDLINAVRTHLEATLKEVAGGLISKLKAPFPKIVHSNCTDFGAGVFVFNDCAQEGKIGLCFNSCPISRVFS